jgi:putative ABC transport system permease protein
MSVFTGLGGASSVWFSGLSRRPLRVLLTVLGIAAGVMLSFSVAAQNASLTSGAAEVYRELAGRSTLELVALGPEGMGLPVAGRVRRLPGVAAAAPVSEEWVTLRHGERSVNLRLFGVDGHIAALGGALTSDARRIGRSGAAGLYLPPHVASELGAGRGARVEALSRIGATAVDVAGDLPARRLGALADAQTAFAALPLAERLTGGGGRIQRILVVPRGRGGGLVHALQAAGGPGTVVWSTGTEIRAVDQASALDRSSSSLFAALGLAVGGLLAYSAMVLTMAERRREVATMRALGCGLGALLFAVLIDALALGVLGTALGLLGGRLALGWLLPSDNGFLSSAFLLSSRVVVPLSVLALSCAAGVLTTLLAAALPARALARVAPAEALHTAPDAAVIGAHVPARLLLAPAAVLGIAGVLSTIWGAGELGLLLWVLAGLLTVPAAVPWSARTIHRLLPGTGGAARVGVAEVAGFPARAIATAAVVTLSVSGLVIVNGAVANLESGTARLAASSYPENNLFVTASAREEVFFTQPLATSFRSRLTRLPFLAYARPWRSAFLDWGERRVLAYAFTNGAPRGFRSGELIEGDARRAASALASETSAVAISSDLAAAHGLRIGSRFLLPTPAGPRRVRVVALITNYGWVPGALALNAAAFASWWGAGDVTAYQIGFAPGIDRLAAVRGVRAALAGTGLTTVTSAQMRARAGASARSQLANLQRIGQLIALAGLLAVTAATLAGVLGRIRRMSALRTIGMSLGQVALALVSEIGCIVGIGALLGALVGLVGHALVIHYLSSRFAMAVAFGPSLSQLTATILLSAAIVLAATLVALRWVARAPLAASLFDV